MIYDKSYHDAIENSVEINSISYLYNHINEINKALNLDIVLCNEEVNEYNDYQWVFGNMLFENYLTEFDYETHLITFYSSFPFKRDNNVVYTILLVNIIILFVMNIYSIIIKMNKFN